MCGSAQKVMSERRRHCLDNQGLRWAYYGAMGMIYNDTGRLSRRRLLTGLAAAGAGALLSSRNLRAQAPGGATRRLAWAEEAAHGQPARGDLQHAPASEMPPHGDSSMRIARSTRE